MPKKQKTPSSKIKHSKAEKISLAKKKTATDADDHLAFSITKKVIHNDDYSSLVKKKGYAHKKKAHKEELESESKKGVLLNTIEKIDNAIETVDEAVDKTVKTTTLKVKVNKRKHSQSPYVVRLLSENDIPSKEVAEVSSDDKSNNEDVAWVKEVERLRKNVSQTYKGGMNKVSINLLGKKSKKHKSKREPFKIGSIPNKIVLGLLATLKAIMRWVFEFLLSIPLGFLLAFQVLLKLVEKANLGAVKAGRSASNAVSWTLEQFILGIVAIVKGGIIIPIKLFTLVVLGVYRLISSGGTAVLLIGNAVFETVKNYFSVFANPPKKFYRSLGIAAIIAAVVVIPVKFASIAPSQIRLIEGKVLGATQEGYENISLIGESIGEGQAEAAEAQLLEAQLKFNEARTTIDSLNVVVRGMINILPQGQDGLHAISAGEELTIVGGLITHAITPFIDKSQAKGDMVELLDNLQQNLILVLPHLENVDSHLSAINIDNLPESYREKFASARTLLPQVHAAIADASNLSSTIKDVLGTGQTKRYAVLFQNNNELRPSGGFIGSLAFVDVYKGKVTSIEIPGGGAYDFQGYYTEHVKAPKPLQLLNARWELQDANWYPDWPTSAAKVSWFLEKAGYSSVDGVIALQATTLVKLLEILGPIEFPEYEITLTSKNVLSEMQREVELDYDKEENNPKQYIAELAPRVLEQILNSSGGEQLAISSLIKSEIEQKNILLYFEDESTNATFRDRGWQPTIVDNDLDYLSVIHANIGGGKTDGVISESWDQEITINDDGEAVAEITIIRQHNGDLENPFESYNNVDYVRLYTPLGSELISFEGVKSPPVSMFKEPENYYQEDYELSEIEGKVIIDEKTGTRITNEFGKTVFGNWLQVDPGNVLVAKIKYKLPFNVKPFDLLNPETKNGYSLIIQKQPGARAIPYSVSLRYPSNWEVLWEQSVGQGSIEQLGPGLTIFDGDLSKDTGFSILFGD